MIQKRIQDAYYVVLDQAPIGSRPKYDLLFGDPDDAVGVLVASANTIKDLVSQVPETEDVWRTYLRRTDGHGGKTLLRKANKG